MDIQFCLVTRYGAIEINRYVTTIGRVHCNIKLHSAECADHHASLICLPDGRLKLRNRSLDEVIFVNDHSLHPNQTIILAIGDIISFSGVESFRLLTNDLLPSIEIFELELSPD